MLGETRQDETERKRTGEKRKMQTGGTRGLRFMVRIYIVHQYLLTV